MPEIMYLVIGLIVGFLLAWYFFEQRINEALATQKTDYTGRLDAVANELVAANSDNQELRDQLVAIQLEHQNCLPRQTELEARIKELGELSGEAPKARENGQSDTASAGTESADKVALVKIAELERQLEEERGRRHALRSEFERIESQLARSGLGSVQMGGESMSLHEGSTAFMRDDMVPVRPKGDSTDVAQHLKGADPGDKSMDEAASSSSIDADNGEESSHSATAYSADSPQHLLGGDQRDAAKVNVTSSGSSEVRNEDTMPLFSFDAETPVDDLKKIKGIGPVLEKKLHALGVRSFRQIADFTSDDVERVDAVLNFKGRILREDWIGQAQKLA